MPASQKMLSMPLPTGGLQAYIREEADITWPRNNPSVPAVPSLWCLTIAVGVFLYPIINFGLRCSKHVSSSATFIVRPWWPSSIEGDAMTEFAKALFRGGKSPSPTLESLTSQMFSAEEMKEASGSRTTSGRSSTAQVLAGLPAASSSRDSPAAISAIERYGFHSTCLQIKDPIKSIKFYTKVLGMEVVKETDSDEYSMYFLAFQPKNVAEGEADFGSRTGLLQLVHVHGSEDDDSFRIVTGHPGFSHFSISVPDVDRARLRMEKLGVEIVEDGSNASGFAAVADPDGYHIQLIAQNVGQDDKLRAQLEKLMSEPAQDSFGFPQPSAPDEVPDSLRFAKGGSPVSPRSPN